MLDVRLLRENPDAIKKDLRKRGWLDKLPLVDEAMAADTAAIIFGLPSQP